MGDVLLPKQMLYQAELRPDRNALRMKGAGSLAGLRPDATQCGGLRHKFLINYEFTSTDATFEAGDVRPTSGGRLSRLVAVRRGVSHCG